MHRKPSFRRHLSQLISKLLNSKTKQTQQFTDVEKQCHDADNAKKI